MQVINSYNELPPGVYGRHGYFVGKWSKGHSDFLIESSFPMITLEGEWSDLSFLREAGESIKWLHVANKRKTIEGIQWLKNLEFLHLGFEPKDIDALFALTRLKALEIKARRIESLFNLKSLETLRIDGVEEIVFEGNNAELMNLDLVGPRVGSLECLRCLSELRKLELFGANKILNLDFIAGMNNLQAIRVESCRALFDVAGLSRSQSIRRISIVNCPVVDLPKFRRDACLNFLHVGGVPINIVWDDIFSIESLSRIVLYVRECISGEMDILTSAERNHRKFRSISIVGKKDKLIDIEFCV